MPEPGWVRRNRFVAWSSYCCALVVFATLPMALTAAGSGHRGWAMLSGGVCAAAAVVGLTLFVTTVHRDHIDHHAIPSLVRDRWFAEPSRGRRPAPIRANPRHRR
ncbi:hypothetical protein [Nocardia sp. BMG51109]|uniref:hypothetical protein n=1 Tax=Nocardia sp. BMG51109 TaxID=1056816 RepID=UPI0004BBD7A9|nr:hypothetical protein [Nocardia sp. BMG51109]